MLTEGIALRPKVFCQRIVNDCDCRPLALARFARGESAATKDRQTDGGEIIRADAVETRLEGETFRRGRRFLIRRNVCTRALKRFAQ